MSSPVLKPDTAGLASGDREILLFAEGAREWAALRVGGRLVDLFAEDVRRYEGPRRGEVCMGRVDRLVQGGRQAFVDLGSGRSGLLARADGVEPGDPVLVQVDRYALEGKSPRVSEAVSVAGQWLVAVRGGEGVRLSRRIPEGAEQERLLRAVEEFGESMRLVVRTAAQYAELEDVVAEAERLENRLQSFEGAAEEGEPRTLLTGPGPVERAKQDWLVGGEGDGDPVVRAAGREIERADDDALDLDMEFWEDEGALLESGDLAGALRRLLDSRVALEGGGWLSVEPTAALVAVDVNAGTRFVDRNAAEAAGFAAARMLPGELRMRGLGGIVAIDFPPASDAGDERIGRELERALRQDSPGVKALGWTQAGLYELVRTRDRRPLFECFPDGV